MIFKLTLEARNYKNMTAYFIQVTSESRQVLVKFLSITRNGYPHLYYNIQQSSCIICYTPMSTETLCINFNLTAIKETTTVTIIVLEIFFTFR